MRGPGGRHGIHIESPQDFRRALRRLAGYLRGQWPLLAVVGAAIAAAAVLQALVPARLGLAIRDHIERAPDAALFMEEMLRVLAIAVGAWAANALAGLLLIRAGNAVIYRLRRETFAHLQLLPMRYFDARGIGDTISRVTNDIEMIYNAMVNGFPGLLRGLFSIVGTAHRHAAAQRPVLAGGAGRHAADVPLHRAHRPAGAGRLPRQPGPGRPAQRGDRGVGDGAEGHPGLPPRGGELPAVRGAQPGGHARGREGGDDRLHPQRPSCAS